MKKGTWTIIIAVISVISCYSCTKDNPTGIYSCVCNYSLDGVYYTNDTQNTYPRQSKSISKAECVDNGAMLTTSGAKQVSCTTK